jgi:hypothetical protein
MVSGFDYRGALTGMLRSLRRQSTRLQDGDLEPFKITRLHALTRCLDEAVDA